MPKPKDYTGMKFNSLTFVKFVRNHQVKPRYQYAVWEVRCDCGFVFEHNSKAIISGQKKYCPSLIHNAVKQKARWDSRGRSRGGASNHPLYDTWYDMKLRCYKENHKAFKNYGARGIKVCDEWIDNPEVFIEHIMSLGWEKHLTIDRINCDGGYEPKNIRLANPITQANNTRRNRLLTYKDKTKTLADWARFLNMPYGRLQTRIHRGWDIERAFNT